MLGGRLGSCASDRAAQTEPQACACSLDMPDYKQSPSNSFWVTFGSRNNQSGCHLFQRVARANGDVEELRQPAEVPPRAHPAAVLRARKLCVTCTIAATTTAGLHTTSFTRGTVTV